MTAISTFFPETGLTHLMANRVSYYVETANLDLYNQVMLGFRSQRKHSFIQKMLPFYAFVQAEVAKRHGLCLSALLVYPRRHAMVARFDMGRERHYSVMTVEQQTFLWESPSPNCFKIAYGEEGDAALPPLNAFHTKRRVLEFLNGA